MSVELSFIQEAIGLAASVVVFAASHAQGKESLEKARSELMALPPDVRNLYPSVIKVTRPRLRNILAARKQTKSIKDEHGDDVKLGKRDAKHFVSVALLWVWLMTGAALGLLAALIQLVNDIVA